MAPIHSSHQDLASFEGLIKQLSEASVYSDELYRRFIFELFLNLQGFSDKIAPLIRLIESRRSITILEEIGIEQLILKIETCSTKLISIIDAEIKQQLNQLDLAVKQVEKNLFPEIIYETIIRSLLSDVDEIEKTIKICGLSQEFLMSSENQKLEAIKQRLIQLANHRESVFDS